MKQRKWSGSWQSGLLKDNYEPFENIARPGQRVYFRPCDLGIAAFASGTKATWLRYLSPEMARMSFSDIRAEPDAERVEKHFDLTRQELRETADEGDAPEIYGEVPTVAGQPRNYGGARVHVGTGLNYLSEPVFFADWFLDRGGSAHMVWEKQVLYAALAMEDTDFIIKTYKHETQERRGSFRDMTTEYGTVEPAGINALCRQFGGVNHEKVVHSVEGFKTLAAYDRFLARWVARAKLPNPPAPNELS